ncbi:MAG TPA: protein-L-isoaspartate(D-aspartate) O-methyltransferase [Myxococcota bacterium]|nr:protein-L-isoaspartate(D-aspartate) O-methyltransferase [Myxococcota bacterium]HRY93860.1 protein-L-isoaspartate(D-aspartate) O-methyltransferase [Myxococcota bacterium]
MAPLLACLSWLVRALPRRWALGLGSALGWLWFHVIRLRRRVALENLRLVLPELGPRERRRVAGDSLRELGRSAVELLRVPGLDREAAGRLLVHQGEEHLDAARARGRGVLVVTAHFGSFDLLACAEALRGLRLAVVSRELHARGANRFWMRLRERAGLHIVPPRNAALQIHRLLAEGWLVALVIDQHMPPGRGIPVPFLGRLASTTHAPAVLALGSGAPLLPVTTERLPDGRHRVVFEPPRDVTALPGEDRRATVERVTRELNQWLEGRVRARPDHWLWIHRRWKLAAPPAAVQPAPRTGLAPALVWLGAACGLLGVLGGGLAAGGAGSDAPDETIQARRRAALVEQLRAHGIQDERVLASLGRVPRHRFVPPAELEEAYHDHPLSIGLGQTISQPYIVAYMTQALRLRGGEKVLEIGTGSGYQAAVLAALAGKVYTVEILPELSARAGLTLRALGVENVELRAGDGYLGWPEQAPFDAIMLTAAPRVLPQPLAHQLKEGGILCAPLGPAHDQVLFTYQKRNGELEVIDRLAVRFVPMTGQAER